MPESKRRYATAETFFLIFCVSSIFALLGWPRLFTAVDIFTYWFALIATFTAFVSAIGTISAVVISWLSYRRDAREKELKIAQLERELDAAKEKPALPKPKKKSKKVH
jgi:uncharacterized membrane protein